MDVFGFLLALCGMGMFFAYKMASNGVKRRDEEYNASDTELIQTMNRSLQRMEQRIETLEALLMEKADLNEPPTFREVMQQPDSYHR